jgi:hypothetical protein
MLGIGEKMKTNGWRWGLVTFCGCITCGVVGANTGFGTSFSLIGLIAFIVSAFGGLSIGGEE